MSVVTCHLPGHETALAFSVASQRITLGALQASFPLPGEWHFRYKAEAPAPFEFCWRDLAAKSDAVPLFGGAIVVSALPVSLPEHAADVNDVPGDKDYTAPAAASATTAPPPPRASSAPVPLSSFPRPELAPSTSAAAPSSSASSMFSKSFFSSAKAALDSVQKKLDGAL